jgi:hypothetical protein
VVADQNKTTPVSLVVLVLVQTPQVGVVAPEVLELLIKDQMAVQALAIRVTKALAEVVALEPLVETEAPLLEGALVETGLLLQ